MESTPEVGSYLDARGIRTNYHDHGDGPPVLLIHGSGPGVSAWANWRLVIPNLSDQFRVVAPDMAGFGYTEKPSGADYNLDYWREHAIGFLDALDLDKVHIVGNSFGGALAISLAVHVPERVQKLVLMGSVGVDFELTEGLDKVWGYTPSIENMREVLKIFAFNQELVNDDLASLRYEASIRPDVQQAYASMFPDPRQHGVDAMATKEDEIAGITQETLIVHGLEDKVIPVANSERLLRLIPNSQLHIYRNCGHWTQIEQTSRFNKLVSDFLSEST